MIDEEDDPLVCPDCGCDMFLLYRRRAECSECGCEIDARVKRDKDEKEFAIH